MREKLLNHLHRVFDKDPEPALAFRLRYDGTMTWIVKDGVLKTTVTGGTGAGFSATLADYTLTTLCDWIETQAGYTLEYRNADGAYMGRPATILIEGSGDQAASSGDHLYGYNALLWSVLHAYGDELETARAQIIEMLKQLVIPTAAGEWVDEHGGYYGIKRLSGEADAPYGNRIIAEVLRPRGNNVAMEMAIRDAAGIDVKVVDVPLQGHGLRNGTFKYDSSRQHDASVGNYCLFDVIFEPLIGNPNYTQQQLADIINDIIERYRDAGMHLRYIQQGIVHDATYRRDGTIRYNSTPL